MECTDRSGFSALARDHAQRPRHYGPLDSFDGHARITGPSGDTMEFWLTARDGKVERASFITGGCGSSRAGGSMATTLALGKGIEERGIQVIVGSPADAPESTVNVYLAGTLQAGRNTCDH